MNSSQRVVFNTAATYARSVLGAGLALFSVRWVLSALGQTDFGLFSVVGSLIVFITFLNTIMAGSVSRYYAFAIGQGDTAEVNRWFNTALSIHLCIAVTLILIGWPIGEYVIAHKLTIPTDRIPVCIWVFRFSLVSAFANMVSIPYVAMFNAKQDIAERSFWGMLQSILTFTLAYILKFVSGDRLLFYAIGMVAVLIFIQTSLTLRAVSVYRECGIERHHWFDKKQLKEIFSFASWNLIGGLGVTLRDQGAAILLNLFFGPKVNAAYGIGNQISAQTNHLSAAMLGAFSPEITASEGRGDRDRMLSLSLRSCKYGSVLVMLFAIPLMVEMEYALKLWLREPPVYTALFCRLILCTFLIERLSAGYTLAVNAYGKIAAYQATLGMSLLLTLPLAWLFLKLGSAPTSVSVASIMTMAVCAFGRVFWGRHLFGMPVHSWLITVVLPCAIVASAATLAAMVPRWFFPASLLRLFLTSISSVAASLLTIWFIALDVKERVFIGHNIRRLLDKMSGVGPNERANQPPPSGLH
jgi:O-antigen/teichoic acid export membrane protein